MPGSSRRAPEKRAGDGVVVTPAGFFVVRTPHLPVDAFRQWGSGLSAAAHLGADDASLDAALARDRATLRERLRAILQSPSVREAIYVASPSLATRMGKWMATAEEAAATKDSVELPVVRYFERMTTRPTPYGLFAAFGLGRVGAETRLSVDAEGKRNLRIDMEQLVRLCEAFERDPAIRDVLVYRPNQALYEVRGSLHYPALRIVPSGRSYELTAVEKDEALSTALAAARSGARRADIAAALVDDEIGLAEASAFVDELIDAHLLESNLPPPITGGDPLAAMIRALEAGKHAGPTVEEAHALLTRVENEVAALAREPLGVDAQRYESVASLIEPVTKQSNVSRVFQVDMSRGGEPTLSTADVETIARGVRVLRAFSRHEEAFDAFVAAFVPRYEQAEVPLMEALDEESGIGFSQGTGAPRAPAPLVAGVPLRNREAKAGPSVVFHPPLRFMARKLEGAWSAGEDVIRLRDEDWLPFAADARPLPTSLSAMAWVVGAGSREGVSRRFVVTYVGSSAARFLGRFSVWNSELATLLVRHLRDEEAERPDAIFAEVVHLPLGMRVGNILLRPLLREHEIAFCGRSGAPPEQTIPLSDLRVSVQNGRVVLRSARLGREIIPRISSAHNYMPQNLSVYRFLAMLQTQGTTSHGGWSWGPFEESAFLPRVEIGDAILSLKKWMLDSAEIETLRQSDARARFRAAAALREKRGLPRMVGLRDGDNVLPIDLENTMSVDAAAAILKRRTSARLQELFCEPDDVAAESPLGRHACEVVVPLLCRTESPQKAAQSIASFRPRIDSATTRRIFAPGSEWLYAKFYCSEGSADEILRDCVRPVVADLGARCFDGWFFIRYRDPDHHLRLRFHGTPARLLSELLPVLEKRLAPLLGERRVARFELATYERELERYGGPAGIETCERIFEADSEAALSLVERLAEGATEQDRWQWALLGVHRMFDDFGLTLEQKRAFAENQRERYFAEQAAGSETDHAIGARFRKVRGRLDSLLASGDPRVDPAFDARSRAVAPWVAELRRLEPQLTVHVSDLLGSFAHMWNNRMLLTSARAQELVIHDFLARLYTSMLARQKAPR